RSKCFSCRKYCSICYEPCRYSYFIISGKPWFNCRDIYTRIWCCWFNGFNCIGVILLRSFYCLFFRDGDDFPFNCRYYLCLIAFLLFFFGHFIAGLAGMETIILLIAGIILVVLEFFVSGGILGATGVASIIASLFMAGYDVVQMAFSLSIASIIAIFAAIILFK